MSNISYSWVRRIGIIKMSFFPKLIYRFNAMSIKIPAGLFFFFVEIGMLILKIYMESKGPKMLKRFCKRKIKVKS